MTDGIMNGFQETSGDLAVISDQSRGIPGCGKMLADLGDATKTDLINLIRDELARMQTKTHIITN